MRAIILLCCICAAFALEEEDFAQKIARRYKIAIEKAQECVDKTHVTQADATLLGDWVHDKIEGPVCPDSLNRASCFAACCMQGNNIMSDATLNMEKFREHVDANNEVDSEEKLVVKNMGDTCATKVEGKDECEVARNFFRCMAQEKKKSQAQEV